jgi:hypothetical protein
VTRRISFSVEEDAVLTSGAKRRISFTAEERAALAAGAERLRTEVRERDYDGLAQFNANLKERLRALTVARAALAKLTRVLDGPFAADLIEAMEADEDLPRQISWNDPFPAVTRRSKQFLDLLPVVKKYIDAMTADDIRDRWADDDRVRIQQRKLRFVTTEACAIVAEALGVAEIKGPRALEAMRRVLRFVEDRPIDADSVRKRIDMILRARK